MRIQTSKDTQSDENKSYQIREQLVRRLPTYSVLTIDRVVRKIIIIEINSNHNMITNRHKRIKKTILVEYTGIYFEGVNHLGA